MDPDPASDPDPAIFIIDLKDANQKKSFFTPFWRCIYIINKTVRIKDFLLFLLDDRRTVEGFRSIPVSLTNSSIVNP
jgi:hypothetical protein